MQPLVHASSRFRCLSSTAAGRASSRGRVRVLRWLPWCLALALAAGACGRDTITDGVTDSAFVATMAELERVERAPGMDSSARVAARAAALQRRGLTPEQIVAAAGALAEDPERALALYRAIDRAASGDTLPPSPAPGTATPGVRRR